MVFESGAHVGVRRESARKSGRGRSFMQETVTTSRKEGDRYAESHLDQEPRPRILL